MNSKIFKYLKLKSELSAEELKQAESLAAMSEADKQALMEFWGVGVKVTKPVKTRVIEKCIAADGSTLDQICGLTRRAAVHKDVDVRGFHEFLRPLSSPTSKSKRASGMARALNDSLRSRKSQPAICVECGEINDHSNHDLDNGGHEFTTDLVKRVNKVLDGATQPDPDDEERCTAVRDGGRVCDLLLDHNVHQMKTAMGYHEFVGSETAVEVGG